MVPIFLMALWRYLRGLDSMEANTTAPRWGFLFVDCVTVWCERTRTAAEQQTDGQGAPVLQLMSCQKKKNNNKNQRSAIVKQELCKSLPQPRCPQGGGGWGMGVGGQCINWPLPTERVAALLKDGLSVPLVSHSKLTSNETRVEACGVTWRRSHPLFFASAWWNAAANVLRPRPLRSAWKKKKKASVRWALVRSNKRPQNIFDSFLVGQMKGTSLCHFVPFIFSRSCFQSSRACVPYPKKYQHFLIFVCSCRTASAYIHKAVIHPPVPCCHSVSVTS